jgi:mRNA interferase RelE/StbE
MLQVRYTDDALKDLKSIGHVAAGKVIEKVAAYAAVPSAFTNQIKKLKGENVLRLRVGDYRVLFTEGGQILRILRVGHRREIYR